VAVVRPGGFGWFQVRAWMTAFGQTYEQATGAGGLTGLSSIIRVDTGDPTTVPAGTPGQLRGISAILLNLDPIPCVPEPSTVLLVFMGAATLCFLSRKHRSA